MGSKSSSPGSRSARTSKLPARTPWPGVPDDARLTRVRGTDTPFSLPRFATRIEWEERRDALRRHILLCAGLDPTPEKTPLQAIVRDRLERDGYSIEKVSFQSFPGFHVTGNLYRPYPSPKDACPGILNPHGHFEGGRLARDDRANHPRRCANLALQGYVAFLYDMVGYQDSRQVRHFEFDTVQGSLWLAGAFGLQLWNSIRAVDFLTSLPEVDPMRLACTGESGGGTQTIFLTAVDDRIAVSAPVNMVSAHFQGGCVCENAPGLRRDTSNVEIAAMAAPRPLLLVSATGDWTVNTPRDELPAIRSIYALYGRASALEGVQVDAPHNYNKASREAVYNFLARHLTAVPSRLTVETPTPEEPEELLRVFPVSVRLPPGSRTEGEVRSWFRERATRMSRPLTEGLRSVYQGILALPTLDRGDLIITRGQATRVRATNGEPMLVGTRAGGEKITCLHLSPRCPSGVPVLVVHPDNAAGLVQEKANELLLERTVDRLLSHGRSVMVLDPFLTGRSLSDLSLCGRPTVARHFFCFNMSDAACRVRDIAIAAHALLAVTENATLDVVGLGDAGLWCILARPACPAIESLAADVSRFDPRSDAAYIERLYIPGIRYTGDFRAGITLGSPGRLLLHNVAQDGAWRFARRVYRERGMESQLDYSLPRLTPSSVVRWICGRPRSTATP